MNLYDKAVKELGYGMNMPDREDIALLAVWVSRRTDGSPTSTIMELKDEEILTDDVKQRLAQGLRELADHIEGQP
jgi:hypothetical protein